MFKLLEQGVITLGNISVKIPLTRLENILKTIYLERMRGMKKIKIPAKSIGIDAHQFYELYTTTTTRTPYPALLGTEEESRKTMLIKPNKYIAPKTEEVKEKANKLFDAYAGRVLVPGVNVWWSTSHYIVLYSNDRILSNTHYAIRLNLEEDLEPYAEKALTLWFNSVWGLITIMINREETRGPWAQIKMGQWMLMPVLDVSSLDDETLKRLATVFDEYANRVPKRIPEQFDPKNPDEVRLGIDIGFLKAFDPNIDEKEARKELLELYRHVHTALQLWIGE